VEEMPAEEPPIPAEEPPWIHWPTSGTDLVCYLERNPYGVVIGYEWATTEATVTGPIEEELPELPPDLPDPWPTPPQEYAAGLVDPFQAARLAGHQCPVPGCSPRIEWNTCDVRKTWRVIGAIDYRITVRHDFKELHEAGIYTGAVNVHNSSAEVWDGDSWNVRVNLPLSRTYTYTQAGPWDYEIISQKDVRFWDKWWGTDDYGRDEFAHVRLITNPSGCYSQAWADWR
jgi:hypothetical protein